MTTTPKAPSKSPGLSAKERGDLDPAYATFLSAGYRLMKSQKKLESFLSPGGGHLVYVLNERSSLNRVVLMVDPAFGELQLGKISGADFVGAGHSFHAGMSKFPSRINNGKRPETFGRQVHFESPEGLGRFLQEFDRSVPFGAK